jgi:hypothetical protein
MDPARHEELREFHDTISAWLDKDGKSCCNERDCRLVGDYVVGTDELTGEEEYSPASSAAGGPFRARPCGLIPR